VFLGQPGREQNFEQKSTNLREHSTQAANTGLLVAKCGLSKNKKTIEGLIDAANKVHQMTPQIVNAGKIRLHNSSTDVDQHFDNLRREYADALNRLRDYVDDAIDTGNI
jgi:vinculin